MTSALDGGIRQALEAERVVDITTTGRHSGDPRRIEIWIHQLDGRWFITGRPGRRGWYANLVATPDFTLHVKRGATADLPATARAISEETERREVSAGCCQASVASSRWTTGSRARHWSR